MTTKLLIAGFQSLRVCTAGLIFIVAALILLSAPRRLTSNIGTGLALLISSLALAFSLLGPAVTLPDRTDLLNDRLTKAAPIWIGAVMPVVVACLQRSTSVYRGTAVAGAFLSGGALCFAAASRTLSLMLASISVAIVGAIVVPLAADVEGRGARLSARTCFLSLFHLGLLIAGLSMLFLSEPIGDLVLNRSGERSRLSAVGAAFAAIALIGFLGCLPSAAWMKSGDLGIRLASTSLLQLIGVVGLVKLFRTIHQVEVVPLVWAWAMASALYFLCSIPVKNFASMISGGLGFWSSLASAMIVVADPIRNPEVFVGSVSILLFLSLLGPAIGTAFDACAINSVGDVGNPTDSRGLALKLSLFLLTGLPLSLGFWGIHLLWSSGAAIGTARGMSQAMTGFSVVGMIGIGFSILRQLSHLGAGPQLQSMEGECRWQVFASLWAAGLLVFLGLCPEPIFSELHRIIASAAVEMPAAPLKP